MRLKLFLTGLLAALSVGTAVPAVATAQGAVFGNNPACQQAPGAAGCQGGGASPVNPVLQRAITLVTVIAGIVGVIFVIVGGIQYITSAGDPSKAESARNTIIYALVGLLVTATAAGIVSFVFSRLNP